MPTSLRVSFLEVGPQALPNSNPDPQLLPGEAGTLPLLLMLVAIYALADRLWRKGHVAYDRHIPKTFDSRRFAMWVVLTSVIAFLLLAGLATGVGASLELFDYFRRDYTGYYAPGNVIDAFTSDPLGQGFWLTAMLHTTLIPTSLHLMAVGSGLLSTLARPIKQDTRLSTVLMYGPAHPLFDLVSRQAAWFRLTRVIRTTMLAFAWMALLGWLVMSMLNSGVALQLLGNSLRVGQQFTAIVIDIFR